MASSRHSPSIELFAYPWDIVDRGARQFVAECRDLGVTRVHVTTLYHSGKFFLPRNTTSRVYFPQPGAAYVPLDGRAFETAMAPVLASLASSGWLDELSRATDDAGLSLGAWTVFQHNSTLGQRNPRLAVRNVFGDSYPFALCPSWPEVRRYNVALAKAVMDLGSFDTLDLETIGYLGYAHGYHHEVTAVPMGPLEHFLLSFCFCEACEAAMSQAGIAPGPLRHEITRILLDKVQRDDATTRSLDNMEQIASLLAVLPDLQRLAGLRTNTVTGLVQEVRKAVGPAKLSVFTSSFVGSPSNIWMEGVSLKDLSGTVDGYQLLAYTADTDLVNSDLVFCNSLVGDPSKLNLTLNLGLPITPSLNDALAKVEFASRLGVTRFSFFNYGFLGEQRLRWIKQIADVLSQTA